MNNPSSPERQRHPPEAPNRGRASVLIVDGVCVLSEALANTLMRENVAREVRTVADKDAAVSIVQSFRPEVVVLNVTCPDVLATFAAMRTVVSDLQVIAVGVGEFEDEILACAEAG